MCVVCVFIIEDNLSEEEASGSADILVPAPSSGCVHTWPLWLEAESKSGRWTRQILKQEELNQLYTRAQAEEGELVTVVEEE